MTTYNVSLLETRLSDCAGDDTAIFNVSREDNGKNWQVATLISPLFRHLYMERQPTEGMRRDAAVAMGVRAIAKHLEDGLSLEDTTYIVLRQQLGNTHVNVEPIGQNGQLAISTGNG